MADYGFGEQLASARRNAGLSIQQVSDALRIRNDIVRAIEMHDFANMPAKAFSRNQVSAYARYLGLDSTAITRSFLEAYSEFEHEAALHASTVTNMQQPSNNRAYLEARKAKRAQDEMESRHRAHGDRTSQGSSERRQASRSHSSQGRDGSASGSRRDGAQRRTRPDGSRPRPAQSGGRSRAANAVNSGRQSSRRAAQGSGGVPRQRTTRKQRNISRSTGTRSLNQETLLSSLLSQIDVRKAAIAVAGIIIFIILLSSLTRCGASNSTTPDLTGNEGSSTVQVTGGSSTSENSVSTEQANAITATPDIRNQSATSFALAVALEADHSSWMQIVTDDTTPVAEQVQGPQTYEYTVTGKAVLEIGNPTYVTVKVNNKQVELNVTDDGLGTLTITRGEDGTVTTGE